MTADRPASWYESAARARVAAFVDAGSFVEFLPPTAREVSPHLPLFDLPVAFDDGVTVGRAALDGREVFVAAQEGRFMGGAIGEVHGAKLVGLLRAAAELRPAAVVLLLDSGGVRLQEANAGETAIGEVMAAICAARGAGVPVVAVVGGRAGAFGGAGLIAGTCARIVVTEQGRIGVSGPEVIETNHGVDEFDSRDRALVWRTTGGRHRALTGGADAYAADDAASLRAAVRRVLDGAPAFDVASLRAEHDRLATRLRDHGTAEDAPPIWAALGAPADMPEMDDGAFADLVDSLGGPHDAG